MKKFGILLLPLLFLTACGDDSQKDVIFEMTYQVNFEIPAGLNTIEDHYFQFKNINSTLDSLLVFHGFTRDDITTINPKTARFTSLFADEEYDFIHECSMYLFQGAANSEIYEAFWRTEIPLNTRDFLDMPGTLLDATDFFLEPKFNLEWRLDTRTITPTFLTTRADFTFVVRGK